MQIAIIVGSTRAGRASEKVAKWVEREAKRAGLEPTIVDLAAYELPFFDEPISPQYNPQRQAAPAVQQWLDEVAAYDGYVIVTPEYNRSIPAVLKNALDYLDYQMKRKPVAIVAYGSSNGAQAVSHLRGITAGVLALSVPEATFVSLGDTHGISDEGVLSDEAKANPYGPQTMLDATLESLRWYAEARQQMLQAA